MHPQAIIETADLRLSLGNTAILRGISFSVKEGEYVSIIGPNGAGKSTFVKCLAGIYRDWQGELNICGADLRSYPHRELAKQISYVPQGGTEQLPFSVHEFVMMGRYPHLSPFTSCKPEDEKAVEHALELTGAREFRDRMMYTLSGGERQNVFVAAALAQGASILLLDEPVTFLDYKHQVNIMKTLKKINRDSGITIVAVSHDLNDATTWSDQVMAIRDGQNIFHGPPVELLDNAKLREIYDMPFHFVPNPNAEIPFVTPADYFAKS
ncbi:MAG: ABC transporter ATP-binding protein [Lentisphaeria bacterium]